MKRLHEQNEKDTNKLTVQPVSTETGRCFLELFWSCCPSVTWTGQSCCQTNCARCCFRVGPLLGPEAIFFVLVIWTYDSSTQLDLKGSTWKNREATFLASCGPRVHLFTLRCRPATERHGGRSQLNAQHLNRCCGTKTSFTSSYRDNLTILMMTSRHRRVRLDTC